MDDREGGGLGFIAGGWPLDSAKATLVFIHGAGGSSGLWVNQVEALKDRANTIAIDLPGHGRSEGPGCTKVGDYAKVAADFIEAIEAPRPIPVGLSMGGAITQSLLLDYPGRFPAGVLVSTGARLRVLPQIFETIEKNFAGFIDMMGKFSASPKTPPEVLKAVLEDTAKCEPEVILGDFRACDAFDVIERLGEIETPALIVSGQDDMLTPPKYGDFLEQKIKGSKRVHLMDCGHLGPVEKPEELNGALVEFLDEIFS
jgi:pimeloyl-ACP methyl ester carboxylesterase